MMDPSAAAAAAAATAATGGGAPHHRRPAAPSIDDQHQHQPSSSPPRPPSSSTPSSPSASIDAAITPLFPRVHDGERSKKQRAETWERIALKLQAGAWVLASAALLHYTKFVHVLLHDERIYRGYFHVAMMCVGVNLCIGCYLTIYLPFVKGIDLDWAIYCPRMVPAATLTAVLCAFSLASSIWPVYGFFSPLILLIFFLGSIFSLHFIPWPL